MQNGYAKVARGHDKYALSRHALGMPAPDVWAWATIPAKLLGCLAVLRGAFIPAASVPGAAVLLVSIFTVYIPNGFSSIKLLSVDAAGAHFGQPGYETPLLYLASLASLVLGGSGPLALDRFLLGREDAT